MGMRGRDNGELVGVACYKSGSAEKSDLVLLGSKTELVKVADIIQIIYLITKPILLFGILTRALSFHTYFTLSHLYLLHTFTVSHFHTFIQMLLTILTMAVALLLPPFASPLPSRHLGRSGRQVSSPS